MYYVVVNPASRSGRGAKIWALLEPVLRRENIPYRAYLSEGPGHVVRIVQDLTVPLRDSPKGTFCRLIVLGGDGTLNEVLQGIADFDRVQLGYIPTGSSNDLARDLYLTREPVQILRQILSCGQATKMDLGCVRYESVSKETSRKHGKDLLSVRYFSVSSGIGFDAAVCEEALSSRFKNILNKLGLGKLTYLVIALKQLIAARKVSCDLYLDGNDPVHIDKFLFVAGMVHQYEGGGFKFCPGADFCDGLLDICAVGDISKLLVLFALPTAFTGSHYRFNGIDRYRAGKLRLVTSLPLWVHTDGEVAQKADAITLTCEQEKLQMLL